MATSFTRRTSPEVTPQPLRRIRKIQDPNPLRYIKSICYDQGSEGYSSKKIKGFLESLRNGFVEQVVPRKLPTSEGNIMRVLEDYSSKKVNQSLWIQNTRKREQAKNGHINSSNPENSAAARKKAKEFLLKVRDLNLIELPKISYFEEMIKHNCSKISIAAERTQQSDISSKRDLISQRYSRQRAYSTAMRSRLLSKLGGGEEEECLEQKHPKYMTLKKLIREYPRDKLKTDHV